jgi:protein SHQ1
MFRFYCKPYFLRLSFPAALVENGREKSSYDLDSGNVYLDIPKEIPGEHFPDLDLLTKLLDMKVIPKPLQSGSLIQSLDTEEDISGGDTDDISWHFNQVLPVTNSGLTASYGFNNMYKDCGSNISELVAEYMDIDNVDTTTPLSRREMRLTAEDKKFDAEYYM